MIGPSILAHVLNEQSNHRALRQGHQQDLRNPRFLTRNARTKSARMDANQNHPVRKHTGNKEQSRGELEQDPT